MRSAENELSTGDSPRLIAIGDIHGCSAALATLLKLIDPKPSDTIVTLGDYVDRGPDSKGVLDQLIELSSHCNLVPLLGNHEEMMLGARGGRDDLRFWLNCGGISTLESYDGETISLRKIPSSHFRFLETCRGSFETGSHIFVHANYDPNLAIERQDSKTRLWLSLDESLPGPHLSGKTAIVGHTPQKNHKILDLGYLKCLDTGCGHDGCLTALDLAGGRLWQVSDGGVEIVDGQHTNHSCSHSETSG